MCDASDVVKCEVRCDVRGECYCVVTDVVRCD